MNRCWLGVGVGVLEAIQKEAERMYPLETGGLLLGYTSNDGDVVVTAIVGPGPNANHQPYTFEPDYEYHRQEIARLYDADPTTRYLGDWHTHPDNPPILSPMDVAVLKKIASTPEAYCPEPIMLIAGTTMSVVRMTEGKVITLLQIN